MAIAAYLDSKEENVQEQIKTFNRNALTPLEKSELAKHFDKLANDKSMQWRKILKPGQLLIFNNWRILHGRSKFKGKRRMSGCYINKEDFESACMMHSVN